MSDTMQALLERLDRLAALLEGGPAHSVQPPAPNHRAFVWSGRFEPVARVAEVDPALLVGVERQKRALYENIRRFLAGAPAHDVLLWGDRGTGKSSLVRTLFRVFPKLALVEVPEPRLPELPSVLEGLDRDPRRWVVYLDDLSFAGTDDRYRELKVLLEGGLRARPENALVVATSNRRHLVPERFPNDGEIHPQETVAEAISLADRFGLSLGFYPFDPATFREAVARHLAAFGVAPPAGWEAEADRWALERGIRSGRTALQAAREIAGDRSSGHGG
ncbi:MAG: ATP-binding protein [Deltaproteobacteria bacterium]|nr:ATP-binding protein [Deltaproteobacteria bacterium]